VRGRWRRRRRRMGGARGRRWWRRGGGGGSWCCRCFVGRGARCLAVGGLVGCKGW